MLRTFETDEDEYQKLKEICLREKCRVGDKLNELIAEYIKQHGSGNPVYQLDNWKDPDFKVCPAFFHNSGTIHEYMMKCKDNEFATHKFKLNEWIHAFKQRYGESP